MWKLQRFKDAIFKILQKLSNLIFTGTIVRVWYNLKVVLKVIQYYVGNIQNIPKHKNNHQRASYCCYY